MIRNTTIILSLVCALLMLNHCTGSGEDYGTNDARELSKKLERKKERYEGARNDVQRILNTLHKNLDSANSEGMKKRIQLKIQERKLTLKQTEKRIANLDSIIDELHEKYMKKERRK